MPKQRRQPRRAFFQAVKGVGGEGCHDTACRASPPLLQLNFGTDDIAVAAAAKTVIKSTSLMVEGAYKHSISTPA